jgi:subtilisin family serine protease
MQSGKILRWRAGWLSIVLPLLAWALCPAGAGAAGRPGDGALSSRLAQLVRPAVRSDPRVEQAAKLSVAPYGPGSLQRQGKRVLVDVRFERGALTRLGELRGAGARVVHTSRRYQTVTVAAEPAGLRALAAVPGVESVTEVLAPIVAATGCAGLVTSEGDAQLNAASTRAAFNLDGAGVTVGILSDSFDRAGAAATHAGGDVASGDLPGPGSPCGRSEPVGILDDFALGGLDEGRAMAQIVHDLAPGARLAFASATSLSSPFAFADNIRALQDAGADVLVDDIAYFDEPFFQDGPVAVAIDEVTALGAAYFSAAGNDNLIDGEGRSFASWEAPAYRDSGACPAGVLALSKELEELEEGEGFPPEGLHPTHCMDFDPDDGAGEVDDGFGLTVAAGETLVVDLQWAEPWFGVDTDLDAFLLDSTGEPIAEGVEDNTSGSQRPFETIVWENDSDEEAEVELAINRYAGLAPRLKLILLENGFGVSASEYPESAGGDVVGPTVFGHRGAASAVGVGAVRFNDGSKPEDFSSRGPVTHYFGPVTGTAAAQPLNAPRTISKPDLAASDGGASTFFGSFVTGVWRFFGTSAAAPHAAAVAALMKEANPVLPLAQLRLALAASAKPVGAFGPEAVGAGLVDAYGAVGSVALPPAVSILERPRPLGNDPRPAIGFAANRPATFACMIDGDAPRPCASPYVTATRLSEGPHGFVVQATDVAGRVGQSELVSFEVDTRRPRTFFRRRPPKTIRTRHRRAKAVFRFGSNERDVTFVCRVDGGLPRFCKRRLARRFRVGRHLVRVRARDAAGNLDRSPAVHRFEVVRRGG